MDGRYLNFAFYEKNKYVGVQLPLKAVKHIKMVSVHRFRVQRSGLGTRTKLKTRSPRKKCWFCHIIANAPPTFRLGITKPGVSHINTPPPFLPPGEGKLIRMPFIAVHSTGYSGIIA